jgi:hypothetical protein
MNAYRRDRGGSIVGAMMMIVVGFMFLAAMIIPGLTAGEVFGRGWPVLVIATGVITLIGNIVKAPFRGRIDIGGPIIVITVGVLFALQNFADIGFHRTWPVLLVVIGIGFVLKRLVLLPFLPFLRRRL